ncbi:MAG: hypothetical protein Q7T48_11825 [Cellvibrio sp.]|uniref:DUF6988 family protein n=1 Tax=Cellvibrio sp. TaxID=1965322 RepID=UPI00272465C5|nr:hypothetical protein [Cellvibrio sp.]
MLTDNQLNGANAYGEWLRLAVHEKSLPANNRVRAAGSCFGIAQDHHHAIIVLLNARLYASCFALLRVAFEAYVRGEWLALCATDTQVQKFLEGCEPPNIDKLLDALARKDAFKEGRLSLIKSRNWKTLCGYTHTGGIHVQRWNTPDGIEANYSTAELLEVLRFAEIIVTLSVLGVLSLADDAETSEKLLERFKVRMEA